MKNLVTVDSRIRGKVADLFDLPVIVRVNEFDDQSVEDFAEDMEKAHQTGQPVIPVVIDSYGGRVYSLLAMISEINHSELPVATIAIGKAMSCGSILLSCGAEGYRFMDQHAQIMIHDVSSMNWGKNEELKASARQTDKLQKLVFHMMAKNCGHPKNYFLDIIHEKSHAEWYLGAVEAKKHNLVNSIGVPRMKVNVNVEMEFEM